MKKLIIVGAGGHAAEIRDYINHHNAARPTDRFHVVGFLDDDRQPYEHYGYSEPFLGAISDHEVRSDVLYIMGIANLAYRKIIISEFEAKGAQFTGLIHPTAIISPSCTIGRGTVVSHNASVGAKAVVGEFCMLNSRCTIGHDTVIGNYNFISPQVALSGHTKIGNENLIGTNACTIPGMTIGNNNKVAAGMIIYKPVGDNETVMFKHKERLVIRDNNAE